MAFSLAADAERCSRGFLSFGLKGCKERVLMMNNAHGWMGGGMWGWTFFCVLVLVLLVVMINKVSTK
jgi:uncharacterized membrane protein